MPCWGAKNDLLRVCSNIMSTNGDITPFPFVNILIMFWVAFAWGVMSRWVLPPGQRRANCSTAPQLAHAWKPKHPLPPLRYSIPAVHCGETSYNAQWRKVKQKLSSSSTPLYYSLFMMVVHDSRISSHILTVCSLTNLTAVSNVETI